MGKNYTRRNFIKIAGVGAGLALGSWVDMIAMFGAYIEIKLIPLNGKF